MLFSQRLLQINKATKEKKYFKLGSNIKQLTPNTNARVWNDVDEARKIGNYGLIHETDTYEYHFVA